MDPSNRRRYLKAPFLARLMMFVGLSTVVAGVFGLWVQLTLGPASPPGASMHRIIVPPEVSTQDIASLLHARGIIRNEWAFRGFVRYKGLDTKLKAGEYDLAATMSIPEIVEKLFRGELVTESFTVPEGKNTQQIAELLADMRLVSEESFMNDVSTGEYKQFFVKGLPEGPRRLEGYLFPDTYRVARDVDAHIIIDAMLKRFAVENERLQLEKNAAAVGLSLHEAVIVASLIEKEARYDEERATISGVLHNRLRLGMPLQVDATVLYALGRTSSECVTLEDLEVDSPYNTYHIIGLPPGPIANPGTASLAAAVHPQTTSYLYYVAKPDGSHAFAVTLAEHNYNRSVYQD